MSKFKWLGLPSFLLMEVVIQKKKRCQRFILKKVTNFVQSQLVKKAGFAKCKVLRLVTNILQSQKS